MAHVMVTARLRGETGYPTDTDLRLPDDVPLAALSALIGRVLGLAEPFPAIARIEQAGQHITPHPDVTLAAAGVAHGAILTLSTSSRLSTFSTFSTFASPAFDRPPRVRLPGPSGEIELVGPPAAPAKPRLAWPSVLMPALFGAASLAATIALSGNGNGLMNAMTTGFMALSSVMTLWTYSNDRRAYAAALRARAEAYTAYLTAKRERLQALATQQTVAALDNDPDPTVLHARILRRAGLWMRERDDTDFLRVRLGLGELPLDVALKPPRHEPLLQPDPLADAALSLCATSVGVRGVPVTLALRALPALGLAGPRAAVVAAAQALALQLAGHHTPDDLRVAAIFAPEEQADWDWLRWLPHAQRPDGGRLLAADAAGARRVLAGLAAQPDDAAHTVLLLGHIPFVDAEPAFADLLRHTRQPRTLVFLADDRHGLPRECAAFVDYEGGRARLYADTALAHVIDRPDHAERALRDSAARAMAGVRLRRAAAPLEIPTMVPLLDLWQTRDVAGIDIAAAWRSTAHLDDATLAVPIGRGAGGAPLLLDLRDGDRGHGAHGLVAGTTGAGKSELLQTLIAALAARFHPDWLSFLLIDYKGGGMASAFQAGGDIDADIPHLAGVITNLLDSASARRALAALDSELKRRQRVFDQAGVTYIDAYQRLYAARDARAPLPMPRLVIIVDEFAELKRDQPEFMKQLISAARIGRSLGVHLILATQKPSGVVDDQIWSNSRFKLCLRVQDEGDSKEMLKRPDAARLTRAGRAFFLVGNGERFEQFQSGFGGALYQPDADPAAAERFVAPVGLDGRPDMRRAHFVTPQPVPHGLQAAPVTQLQALMTHVRAAAREMCVAPAVRIWLDPLPALLLHDDARLGGERDWLRVAIGLCDDPRGRSQPPLRVDLARDGHLLIYGQPGSGKSTLLLTLVMQLARAHQPDALHITVLDFGSRALRVLEALPHVGDVLTEDDDERLQRLFRQLRQEITLRKALLEGRKFSDYRRGAVDAPPALLLIIDNYPAVARLEHDETLTMLVRDGAPLGVHVVLSANKPLDVRSRVSGNITAVLCLQQTDRSDYSSAVGRTGGMEPAALPGRGLCKSVGAPLECQVALPAPGATEGERVAAMQAEARAMRSAWGARPAAPRIAVMPDTLTLRELPPSADPTLAAPVGLHFADLQPCVLPLGAAPHIVITGTPQSGKSMLLRTLALSLARVRGPDQLQLLLGDAGGGDAGLASLSALPQTRLYLDSDAGLTQALDHIEQHIAQWRADVALPRPAVVLLLDDADMFLRALSRSNKERLDALLERGAKGLLVHIVLAGPDRALDPMDGWVKRVKDAGCWVVLGGLQSVGYALRLPAGERDKPQPPGVGYWVSRRQPRPQRFKTALPWADGARPEDVLSAIASMSWM